MRGSFVFASILLAAGCAGGSSAGVGVVVVATATPTPHGSAQVEQTPPGATATATAVATPTSAPGRLTIAAAGDVMLARSIGRRIVARDPAAIFEGVTPVLAAADIVVVNLETAVSDIGSPQAKGYAFRAPPEAIDALVAAGVDVAALANNHALDYGQDALLDTIARLRAAGIAPAGAGATEAEARTPAVIERNGLRIAFLGYVDTPAEGSYSRSTWDATAERPGVAWASVEKIAADVAAARALADIVVVLLHAGVEYSELPSQSQRAYAEAAIDAGALLVLGTHAHVLQPVEEYGGGLIAYSLGNFVFDGFDGLANETAILRITIEGGLISAWELLPARVVDGLPQLLD